jgi:pyruvate/2-oxoglutarate dehydrogenase complex dihydrolipoamide acyltransferase (E2) component
MTDRVTPLPGEGVVRAIGQVIAALAGGIGVVYVIGGLIVWLRLLIVGKPQLAVVSELPREVLISGGLVVVVLAIAAGATYAFRRLAWRPGEETPAKSDEETTLIQAVGWGAALATPTWIALAASAKTDEGALQNLWIGDWFDLGIPNWIGLVVAGGIAWALGAVWARFAIQLWHRVCQRYWTDAQRAVRHERSEAEATTQRAKAADRKAVDARTAATAAAEDLQKAVMGAGQSPVAQLAEDAAAAQRDARAAEETAEAAKAEAVEAERPASEDPAARARSLATQRFNRPGDVALSALVWAGIWLPAFFVAAASVPLPEARACLEGRNVLNGEFIGETTERVYIVDSSGDRIVVVPNSELHRTYVGDEAGGGGSADATCPS